MKLKSGQRRPMLRACDLHARSFIKRKIMWQLEILKKKHSTYFILGSSVPLHNTEGPLHCQCIVISIKSKQYSYNKPNIVLLNSTEFSGVTLQLLPLFCIQVGLARIQELFNSLCLKKPQLNFTWIHVHDKYFQSCLILSKASKEAHFQQATHV